VSDILMPLTPERVWRAIHQGGDGGGRATAGTTAYGGASTETTTGESTDASSLGGDR
jgi:carbon-monoxide dehydrogenase large subunit